MQFRSLIIFSLDQGKVPRKSSQRG